MNSTQTTETNAAPAASRRWLSTLWRLTPRTYTWAILAPLCAGALLIVQAWYLAYFLDQAIRLRVAPLDLIQPLLLIATLVGTRALIIWSGDYAAATATEHIKQQVRHQLFAKLLQKGPAWSKKTPVGALSVAILDQVQALDGYLQRFLPAAISAVFLPLAFTVAVLPVDWIVALLFLFSAPLIPVFMALIGMRAEAANQRHQKELSQLSGVFADRIRGLFTLALLGRTQDEVSAVGHASQRLSQATLRVLRIAFLSSAVLELFAALGVAGVAVYIGLSYLGMLGSHFSGFSLQHGLFCLLLAPEVYNPLRQLAASYHDRATAKVAVQQLQQLYTELPTFQPVSEHTSLPAFIRKSDDHSSDQVIRAKQWSVQSPTGRCLLKASDFTLCVDQPTVLLGASGVGKSSLLESLVGLRPDATGQLIHSFSANEYVLLGAQPFMALGSIADFLRVANPQATDSQLWLALEQAQLATDIKALPEGLATQLGTRGYGLSGGQAQRLAVARLFLTSPRLIVLDEPTAYLDAATRDAVMSAILHFSQGRALLVATHDRALLPLFSQQWELQQQQLLPVTQQERA